MHEHDTSREVLKRERRVRLAAATPCCLQRRVVATYRRRSLRCRLAQPHARARRFAAFNSWRIRIIVCARGCRIRWQCHRWRWRRSRGTRRRRLRRRRWRWRRSRGACRRRFRRRWCWRRSRGGVRSSSPVAVLEGCEWLCNHVSPLVRVRFLRILRRRARRPQPAGKDVVPCRKNGSFCTQR
jgi:hypothetical protein